MNKKHLKMYLISLLLSFLSGIVLVLYILVIFRLNLESVINYTLISTIILSVCLLVLLGLSLVFFKRVLSKMIFKNENNTYLEEEFDNLTQIYTFDYFINQIENMETPFSLIMLDIDCFRDINLKHGTVIGDLILKVVAKAIKEHVRSTDIIARYQGDAFVIILKSCPEEVAVEIMSRIRLVILENDKLSDKNIKISTSIGIYYVKEKEISEMLFTNAIEALKSAKTADESGKVVLIKKDDLYGK